MDKPIKIRPIALFIFCLTACGDVTSTDSYFDIHMFGVYETPITYAGVETPNFQNFTLIGVNATEADSGAAVPLVSEVESTEFRIIDRAQRIFRVDLKDYKDKTWNQITIDFSPTISGGIKEIDGFPATLESAQAVYNGELAVVSGRDIILEIRVKWKDTILDGFMEAPDLVVEKP